MFISSIFTPWAVVSAPSRCAVALIGWFWPKDIKRHPEPVIDMIREPRFTGDLAELPTHAFGTGSLTWWGIIAFFVIEGTAFALAIAAYFFLMGHEQGWPPEACPPPDLLAGTLFTIVILLSEIPNTLTKRAREAYDIAEVRAADAGDRRHQVRAADHPRRSSSTASIAVGTTMPMAR